MEEIKIELKFMRLNTAELSKEDNGLRDAAIEAATRAYAPYSQFNVGAAVLLNDGTIIEGNNQENVAYPSGLCAERVALFSAGATYPEKSVTALAIVAVKNGIVQPTIAPCGGCRQVMLEIEQRYRLPVRVLLCGLNETVLFSSSHDLLPYSFSEI